MSAEDEARAAAFRASLAARAASRRERQALLAGDDAAAALVEAAWEPVLCGPFPAPVIGDDGDYTAC